MQKIPKILVKTWIQILTKGEDQEARDHARKMIAAHFETLEEAQHYIEK